MLQPEALARFADSQKRLLRRTYDQAWQHGVASYKPDDDPESPPITPREWAAIGVTGAALMALRRSYPYVAPTTPDPVRRVVALAPGFRGVNRMAGELTGSLSTSDSALLASGSDSTAAILDWLDTNGWRLDAGAAVAWAGEQAGFGEAADADGQYLYAWLTVGDTRVCSDCEVLSTYPAMPLSEWPTSPGAGDTECSYGCFLPDTVVEGTVRRVMRSQYAGQAVKLRMASGKQLAVTSNHPVLTTRGWVAAQAIRQGDNAIGYSTQIARSSSTLCIDAPDDDIKCQPTSIEQLFRTLELYCPLFSGSPRSTDLHGDAVNVQGQIDVISINSQLLRKRHFSSHQQFCKSVLKQAFTRPTPLFSACLSDSVTDRSSTGCFPTGTTLTLNKRSIELLGLPFSQLCRRLVTYSNSHLGESQRKTLATHTRFRTQCVNRFSRFIADGDGIPVQRFIDSLQVGRAIDLDTALLKVTGESAMIGAQFPRQLSYRDPAQVTLDEVVEVSVFEYIGPVFDIETVHGWIVANGIYCSNCRCSWDVWGAPPPDNYAPQLTGDQQAVSNSLANQQLQALNDMMPDVAYLE